MQIDNGLFPVSIEFCDWHIVAGKIKYKVIIDISECELTARKHITSTHKVNVKTFEIEEADINAISSILNYDNLNSYNGLADKAKTELGYRDGWRTEYKVCYCNGQCLSGKLSIIFEESPLEQVIRLLREKYPYIEIVKHI